MIFLQIEREHLLESIQDYLAATDDKERERELLAEVIIITWSSTSRILNDSTHCDDRDWVGDLVAGQRVQVVGGEDGRGGEGGRQAPAGKVAFFQPSIHQVDDHSDVQVQSGCGWSSPGWDLAIAET